MLTKKPKAALFGIILMIDLRTNDLWRKCMLCGGGLPIWLLSIKPL